MTLLPSLRTYATISGCTSSIPIWIQGASGNTSVQISSVNRFSVFIPSGDCMSFPMVRTKAALQVHNLSLWQNKKETAKKTVAGKG
jgi:hypothetical protein